MLKDPCSSSNEEGTMLRQLKEKFHTSSSRSEKIQVLTVLPMGWSIRRVQDEFEASDYMVRRAKELVRQKGILSTPDLCHGHPLSSATTELVHSFYNNDVSRMMPGKKYFISVRGEEGRVHIQKRLVLTNLKEVYLLFKERFPTEKIGFSKFAELRPKHCILAGASGTHSVCVCAIHQNVKLLMRDARICDLTADDNVPLTTYHTVLAHMMCNPPLPACHLNECNECPGISAIRDRLVNKLDAKMIETITFKQWVSVDRCELETMTKSVDDFVEYFCEKVVTLLPHSFVATQQAAFCTHIKKSLKEGDFLVTADFSENYSFVIQDAIQGFHWNNSQATVHPFVAYHIKDDELCHVSYVVISECLQHNTVAVYSFQRCFIEYLKQRFPLVKQIYYFSDGAASQYKNRKNFLNLCYHHTDFGIAAEWHFSATSHGKGACDGVGGTVKRLAARASLQSHQITTPYQLYEWA